MIKIAFDREGTGPVTIGGKEYTYEPIPDFQDSASDETLLRMAAKFKSLELDTPLSVLRERFELRLITKAEKLAMIEFFFGANKAADEASRAQQKQEAKAILAKMMVSDDGGVTMRPMTNPEAKAFLRAIDFGLTLNGN